MEQTKCEFDVNYQKLIGRFDEIVDFSHRVPVKRVQMWIKSGESDSSLYSWMSTVCNADSLASVLMDSSLYGWTIDCADIHPYDCYVDCTAVEFYLSRRNGEYNTNITPELIEALMHLTWESEVCR